MKSDFIKRYEKLNSFPYDFVFAEEFQPSPTESDYKLGEIERFFLTKHSGEITEVGRVNYKSSSPIIYTKTEIRWIIVGEKSEVYRKNLKTIKKVGLEDKLINPLQFYKSETS
jgi:hypothetical protein